MDAGDWRHLHDAFGIRSVLNVDHNTDAGKGIQFLSECPVPDDGTPFPRGLIRHAVSFARMHIGIGGLYVHCHAGISRSPAFAYAILRWITDMSPGEALSAVRKSGTHWGDDYGAYTNQKTYLDSVEKALSCVNK